MTAPPVRKPAAPRLDAAAWIVAALDTLARSGIDGVRVEVLAKDLAVTKGSFYWHFKDRPALLEAMLNHWKQQATLALIERLDRGHASAETRLRQLLKLPLLGKRSAQAASIELAIRLWGHRDARAQAALADVDALRLTYIGSLLEQCGVPKAECGPRAVLAYSYMRVAATLLPAQATAAMTACEDILIGVAGRAGAQPA